MSVDREEEQKKILEEAELFVDSEVRPYVNKFEEQGGVSEELIKKMAEKGYLAAPFPKEYGGLELDPVYYGLFTEIFGKACVATRSVLTVHTSLVGETLLRFGTDEQKAKWMPRLASGETVAAFGLSEPETGSNAKGVQTTWEDKGDHYLLNGAKKWITLGNRADLFIIIAANNGKSSAFLVERSFPGFSSKPIEGLMAGRATFLAELHLDNVAVPKENVLGRLNFGFEYIVSTALDHGRYSIAWAGVAIAQEAVDAMVSYSRKRSQFDQKIRGFQLVRGMIGDAVTKVHAARALTLRAGEMRRDKHSDSTMETTMSKYFASKVAMDITNDALQVHGANGFVNDYPVERLYREAKVLEIIEGSSQMQQEIISNFGLTRYFKRGR